MLCKTNEGKLKCLTCLDCCECVEYLTKFSCNGGHDVACIGDIVVKHRYNGYLDVGIIVGLADEFIIVNKLS